MFALDALRDRVGVVTQDTYLFNDTLRANLLLARPDASNDQLALALEQAQLDVFVHRLPKGLETWIGEQGLRLSGGERQRLAIARVLLKDAPILILDEATANLDPITERALLDALDRLMQGRTTLMITHRLIAMERMDEILVLDQGQIIERGTHEQLLAASSNSIPVIAEHPPDAPRERSAATTDMPPACRAWTLRARQTGRPGSYRHMFDIQNGIFIVGTEGA